MPEIEYNARTFRTRHDADLVLDALEAYDAGASAREVARRLGIALTTVREWCRAAGITRSPAEAQRIRFARERGITADLRGRAFELYHGRGLPSNAVGDVLGVSGTAVLRWLGDTARSGAEATALVNHDRRHPYARRRIERIVAVCRAILVDGLSWTECSEQLGVGYGSIAAYLKSEHNPYPYTSRRAA